MKNTLLATLCCLLLIPALSGCVRRLGDFTIISTKNVAFTGGKVSSQYVEAGRCIGKDTKYIILFIPTGNPSIEQAADNCIESVSGHLLTNAVMKSSWYYLLIGATSMVVEGDAWKEATSSELLDPNTEKYELVNGPNGLEMVSTKSKLASGLVFVPDNPNTYSLVEDHLPGTGESK